MNSLSLSTLLAALGTALTASAQITPVQMTGCQPWTTPNPTAYSGSHRSGNQLIVHSPTCPAPPAVAFVLIGFGSVPFPPIPIGCSQEFCVIGVNEVVYSVSGANGVDMVLDIPTDPLAVGLRFQVQGGCVEIPSSAPFCLTLRQSMDIAIEP